MTRLRRLVLLLVVGATCLITVSAQAARPPQYLKLTVEAEEIYQGDVVVLEVRHTGLEDAVDYSILESVGTVRRETAGTMIAVISGKVVEIKLKRIELVPRGRGIVVIGPLIAGDVQSNSVSVDVLAAVVSNWRPGPQDVQAAMRVSTPNPYLQQQVVLDIELRHRYPIASEIFGLPDLSGYRVIERYAARRPATASASDWRIVSWRYLLFAERSGEQTIAPFKVRGSIIKSRRERGEFSVSSAPLALDVRAAQTDGWWLPASAVTISENWSRDKRQLAAGDETIRTISVKASGVTAEQIPDIQMLPTRGLRITALGATRQTELTDQGANAQVDFGFRIRAISPIPVFPDTIRIPWWDTVKDQARTAIVPAQRIQIGMPDRQALLQAFGEEQTLGERAAALLVGTGLRRWVLPVSLALLAGAALFAFGSVLANAGIWPFRQRGATLPPL